MIKQFDKTIGICPQCKDITDCVYDYRDITLRGVKRTGILCSICTECETTVGIPQQQVKDAKRQDVDK